MIGATAKINLLTLGLFAPTLIYTLVTQLWNLPLKNGRSYFLGVEVMPGFYDGPDSRWLSRYHAVLIGVHGTIFAALATVLAMRQWDWIPIWGGGTAVFYTASMMAFSFWARHKVRAQSPVLRAAVSLEPRRLGDYISWPIEILFIAAVACSWTLLRSANPIQWHDALLMTWIVLGLLPGKIVIVRQSWPLPAERAKEHHAAQDAARRYSVRLMNAFGAVPASVLLMAALRHAWPDARTGAAQWIAFGIPAVFAVLLIAVIIGQKRVIDAGRSLRPPGSWTPPFGRAAVMSRAGMTWFAIWFGGILLLLILFR
jgi:hypothetical protein